ncbi:carbohydrate ABC transporter permease [Desertimonas flava]|uniref:carbohydrate ABC transporter permease n=1 Tax=Desertimonas flava TaxID=2064846 RepID=UPI000E344570|nr:carbohydrate ABC transporter permease [Desertimonas flava]
MSVGTRRIGRGGAKAISYAVLAAFAAFYVGPILMLVSTALKRLPEFFKDPTGRPPDPTLDNFKSAWDLANFPGYALNSVIYTVVATTLFVVMGVLVAFPIARGYVRGSGALLTLYVVALFLPPALIPQFQLILSLGLYNTRPGYILLFLVNPIGLIILVNYIKSVPVELDQQAAVDGCGYFRYVFTVLFPLIRPAVATVTVLHAIGIWNELILATIYLTNDDLYPITRGLIVFEGVYGSDWPGLAAAVLMLMLPMLVLFMFLQRYIISGLTAGAVKG